MQVFCVMALSVDKIIQAGLVLCQGYILKNIAQIEIVQIEHNISI